MARPFAVLALALLTALLGGPGAGRAVTHAWSPVPAVRQTPANAPEAFVRATAAWHTALDVRSRRDHQPAMHGGVLPAVPATPSFVSRRYVPLRGTGRHGSPVPTHPRPILTTGPPSHA